MNRADIAHRGCFLSAVAHGSMQWERLVVVIERFLKLSQTLIERADIKEGVGYVPAVSDRSIDTDRALIII